MTLLLEVSGNSNSLVIPGNSVLHIGFQLFPLLFHGSLLLGLYYIFCHLSVSFFLVDKFIVIVESSFPPIFLPLIVNKRQTITGSYCIAQRISSIYSIFFFFFFFFFFFWLHPGHMGVPRLGVQLQLPLPAYPTAPAKGDLSRICDLHHSS